MPARKPARRKPGPRPRLENPVRFTTNLTEHHRDLLEAYAGTYKISTAQATCDAIEALVELEKIKVNQQDFSSGSQ